MQQRNAVVRNRLARDLRHGVAGAQDMYRAARAEVAPAQLSMHYGTAPAVRALHDRATYCFNQPMAKDLPIEEKVARLRHTMLFGGLPAAALRGLAAVADVVEVEPGTMVVREGDETDAMYVVTRGLLRARRRVHGQDQVLGDINKGGFFGEFALLESCPRSATVTALTPAQLLHLSRDAIQQQFEAWPELRERARETLEARRSASPARYRPLPGQLIDELAAMIPGVERPALEAVGPDLEWLWLPSGEVLFHEGEPGDVVYFVLAGALRVFTRPDDGSVITIGEVGRGESVGEMALLSGEPRSASVAAILDTELLRLSAGEFDRLLAEQPHVLEAFRDLMVARLALRARAEAESARSAHCPPLTLQDCDDVVRTRDIVLRNLRITHAYHRLSVELADFIGPQDVNWLAFGAHASGTAGYSIRGEDVPLRELYRQLGRWRFVGPVLRWFGSAIDRSFLSRQIDDVFERVSQAVADGNLRIFADMAPAMVRFCQLVRAHSAYDAHELDAFRSSLTPGPAERDGQDLLGLALSAWYAAAHEPDPKRRAELVLLGNIRIGLHEQIRVQPDIEEALGAPLRHRLGDELGHAVDRRLGWLPAPLRSRVRAVARRSEAAFLDALARALRHIITQRLMRLRLPYESVRMGAPQDTAAGYPPELRDLTVSELIELVSRFSGPDDTPEWPGAADWTRLDQRMRFIVHLFRSRQKRLEMFSPPLDPEAIHRTRPGTPRHTNHPRAVGGRPARGSPSP